MAKAAAEQAVGVLHTFLQDHRDSIQERWLDLIFSDFPANGHEFLRSETNQFDNPIGYTLRADTTIILQGMIDGTALADLAPSLERIVKIRAVQDCLPSEATAFAFHLKTAIRETLETQGKSFLELQDLERTIDRLACDAFDHYMKCKQKIFEIGARAEKMRVAKLLERLNKQRDTTDNPNHFTA